MMENLELNFEVVNTFEAVLDKKFLKHSLVVTDRFYYLLPGHEDSRTNNILCSKSSNELDDFIDIKKGTQSSSDICLYEIVPSNKIIGWDSSKYRLSEKHIVLPFLNSNIEKNKYRETELSLCYDYYIEGYGFAKNELHNILFEYISNKNEFNAVAFFNELEGSKDHLSVAT